jgi:outer membrane protein assembly factor BamD (BamD/ComL family)
MKKFYRGQRFLSFAQLRLPKRENLFYGLGLLFLIFFTSLEASYVFKEGKWFEKQEMATYSVQEHFSLLQEAYQSKNWRECIHQALILKKNFTKSAFTQEATFFLAVGYYHLEEYDFANREFTAYLKEEVTLKHFEEAMSYKLKIAQQFKEGSKKHLLGRKSLPKWMPAKEDALNIFDEIIAALPHHEIGAEALFSRAQLLFSEEEYRESIEAFQLFIRRFPKHAFAPESYLAIGEVYLFECTTEYPDPDLLDLSEINLKKFRESFPTEARLAVAAEYHRKMQEVYAKNLYEVAEFYERTKKPSAAKIYYLKILGKYPETETAERSKKRLSKRIFAAKDAEVKISESPVASKTIEESPQVQSKE